MSGNRRSLRLRGYDYTLNGMYFVTICVEARQCLLGNVHDGRMHFNPIGEMVRDVWSGLPRYQGAEIDAFVIMPNHVHGIIVLNNNSVRATPCGCPYSMGASHDIGQAQGPAPTFSLFDIVHRFKSLTTTRYRQKKGDGAIRGRLWQRNYYEHVIRNDSELDRIRQYIHNNPADWEKDQYHKMDVICF